MTSLVVKFYPYTTSVIRDESNTKGLRIEKEYTCIFNIETNRGILLTNLIRFLKS